MCVCVCVPAKPHAFLHTHTSLHHHRAASTATQTVTDARMSPTEKVFPSQLPSCGFPATASPIGFDRVSVSSERIFQ